MPPRGRPPTRSQSRVQSANIVPLQATGTPEGHVQTLPNEEAQAVPNTIQLPPPVPTQLADTLPQLQAFRHLLDVLEHQSRDLVQQEQSRLQNEALAQAAALQPAIQLPSPPAQTILFRRHRTPPRRQEVSSEISPILREKQRRKPPTPPSSPMSDSTHSSSRSSSDSSSSRSTSPHKKKNKKERTKKDHNSRASHSILEIANCKIPKNLQKPPQLNVYDGRGDPDEHVDIFNLMVDYRDALDHVRYKLFPLSLSKCALKWYRELPPASISSWKQFTKIFSLRFTASRVKPKSTDILKSIRKGEKEYL